MVKVHPVTLQPIIRPQSWESILSEITDFEQYFVFNFCNMCRTIFSHLRSSHEEIRVVKIIQGGLEISLKTSVIRLLVRLIVLVISFIRRQADVASQTPQEDVVFWKT